jgi:hypothetical protein
LKVPRDLSSAALAKALSRVGCEVTRHVTVPAHDPLKVGTLSGILGDVAGHLRITRDELLRRLFD